MIIPKPITKEDFRKLKLPDIYKRAIEKAISTWYNSDSDIANCFRGEIVEMEKENELSPDDDPDYETEFVWFMAGWQAKERRW